MSSYLAKHAYQNADAPREYEERAYYRGALGRWRKARERAAVRTALSGFDVGSTILDCPCGNGRWLSTLASRALHLIGRDVSPDMVRFAEKRRAELPRGVELEAAVGDAEALDLPDDSVDHVFSYALMKHLPREVQRKVLSEFARVSRGPVAVSFAVWNPLSYPLWRARSLRSGDPLWPADLYQLAKQAELRVARLVKVGTPVGMETLALMHHR